MMGSSTRLYYKRLSDGMCGGCGFRPRMEGRTRCSVCDERRRNWYLRNRGVGVRNRADITRDPTAHLRASAKYRKAHADKCLIATKSSNLLLKYEVMEHYGGAICACCGEDIVEFLTLDHIDGDGPKHREEFTKGHTSRFYKALKNAGFPPERLRVLCMNCNWARRHGDCPHQIHRELIKEIA